MLCKTMKLFLLFQVIALMQAGCAVNTIGLPGITHVEYSENHHAYRTQLTVWGLYLSTQPIDRGLSVGYTKRIYIQPKSGVDTANLDAFLRDVDENNWRPTNGIKGIKPGAICFFDRSTGFSLNVNRHAIGLVVGFQSRYILEIDKGYEGIFIVNIENQ